MLSVLVVDQYKNMTTGGIQTVLILLPPDYVPGSERFVTEMGQSLKPLSIDSDSFMNLRGELLVPLA